jgi:hypothetical protein
LRLKENGLLSLKKNKINKKFVYLISPNKIKGEDFYTNLSYVLNSKKVSFFQLRLKKETNKNKLLIGKKIKIICKKYKVKFLVNDDPRLSKKLKMIPIPWCKQGFWVEDKQKEVVCGANQIKNK